MSTNPPLSAARAGVPARQAGEQAQPMGIPTLVPPAPPARPSPPLPRPEEPLNVTNELQSICGHGGKSNYMVRLGGRGRRKVRAGCRLRAAGAPCTAPGGATPAPAPAPARSHRAQDRPASPPAPRRDLDGAGRSEAGGRRLPGAHPATRGSAGRSLPAPASPPACAQAARRAEARPAAAEHPEREAMGGGDSGRQRSFLPFWCRFRVSSPSSSPGAGRGKQPRPAVGAAGPVPRARVPGLAAQGDAPPRWEESRAPGSPDGQHLPKRRVERERRGSRQRART